MEGDSNCGAGLGHKGRPYIRSGCLTFKVRANVAPYL